MKKVTISFEITEIIVKDVEVTDKEYNLINSKNEKDYEKRSKCFFEKEELFINEWELKNGIGKYVSDSFTIENLTY